MELSSPAVHALERSLDGFSLRHQAISNNIANINTPGYVKQEANFEASLLEAFQEAKAPHFDPSDDEFLKGFGPGGTMDGFKLPGGPSATSITESHNDYLLTWQPQITKSSDGPQRLDGNRTPVETEISSMANNAVKYNAVVSVVTRDFQLLKTIAQAK